ncbi:hypothetical protein V2J09_006936 [Rumex salicifolius]
MSQNTKISSYPPVIRPTHQPDPANDRSDQSVDVPDPLPVIDMERLDEAKLHVACSDWGIFRVINHGIPEDLITRLQAAAKTLFDLPFESKREIFSGSNPVYSWGKSALTPAGAKIPAGLPEVGLEIFRFSLAQQRHFDAAEETAISSFRHTLEEYGEYMATLAKKLFKSMASNLKLDQNLVAKGDLDKYLDESSGVLRVNRYPPYSMSDANTKIKGLDAHTDSTVLTILLQDDVHGLQICRDDGLWLPVKTVPNTLVVNLGDMLQAMSDDEYKSVEHKVNLNEHRERISIGYFVFPEERMLVTSNKGKYRPFTCKEFRAQVQEDVAKIGWKVGLSRFLA